MTPSGAPGTPGSTTPPAPAAPSAPSAPPAAAHVSIDTGVCIGAGQCALTAPGVFTQDDDGFGALLPGREDGGGSPLLREAARACPVSAISIEEAR